jgi:CheY-like chemotaxis protein
MPDGQAALEAALADIDGFDILLTDLRMPRLDGTSLLLALRARRPGLPVVVMSGNVPSNWREMMMRELNGLRQPKLITKPMRLDDLRAALQDECASVQG